jgi:predicted TPR repeat methyltransferase
MAVRDGLVVESSEADVDARIATPDTLAALAAELRDHDAVLAAFVCQSRVTELAPENPLQWYRLGELAHIVGRRQVAAAAYERYLRAHPSDAEVEHLLVSLRDERPPARVSDRCIRQLYARFASFYDENMRGDLDYRAPELLGAAIERALGDRRNLRVVDLGCGTGLSGRQLRPRATWLAGVDLSADMVTRARAEGVYDSLQVDEITAYLTGEAIRTFDLVAACDTFIYCGDLRQVVTPAARCLAPGGVLAFTVERGDIYPLQLTDSGRFAHHVRHLTEVAAEAGLSVVEIAEHVLRYEYGVPVTGLTAVFAAPAGPWS